MTNITQAVVRELLDYQPESGRFVWRQRGIHWFTDEGQGSLHARATWNSRYAGKQAGDPTGDGYLRIGLLGGRYKAHRLAFLWMEGTWPPHDVDHVNSDRSDNRWVNLRKATRSQNMMNFPKRSGFSSRFKGVSYTPKSGRWRAMINANRRRAHLGYFDTEESAHAAYVAAARILHGQFARVDATTLAAGS